MHAPEAKSDQESPPVRESKTLLDSFSVELGFRIPRAKISRIPASGFPDIGRQDTNSGNSVYGYPSQVTLSMLSISVIMNPP